MFLLLLGITSIDSLAIGHSKLVTVPGSNRQSKATNLEEASLALQPLATPPAQTSAQPSTHEQPSFASTREQSEHQPFSVSIRRSSFDAPVSDESVSSTILGESDHHQQKSHSNVFFGNAALPKQAKSMLAPLQLGGGGSATFENIAPNYIGPNYLMSSGSVNRNSHDDGSASETPISGFTFPLSSSHQQQQQQNGNPLSSYYQNLFASAAGHLNGNKGQQSGKPSEDSINDVFNNAFKKYNVKKYLLQKILGKSFSYKVVKPFYDHRRLTLRHNSRNGRR